MNTALLVIDVQQGFFDLEPQPFEADGVIERINQLTARARMLGQPVVLIQHESASLNLNFESKRWQLSERLHTQATDLRVRKTMPDAFLRTDLHSLLQSLAVKHLVVCGFASEMCVDSTVRSAAALGYVVTLANDAHTTNDNSYATAHSIRKHLNNILPKLDNHGSPIQAVPSEQITFQRAMHVN